MRIGQSDANPFSLSVRGPGIGSSSIKHLRVNKIGSGQLQLAKKKMDKYVAPNLDALISYYMNVEVGDGVTLSVRCRFFSDHEETRCIDLRV